MIRRLSNRGNVGALFIVVFLIVAGAVFWYMYKNNTQKVPTNFAECKAAGYPIQESYPEVCSTGDGESFSNPTQILE